MNIEIKIINSNPFKLCGLNYCEGEIKIGKDYSEKFIIPVDWWSLDQYKRQWEETGKNQKQEPIMFNNKSTAGKEKQKSRNVSSL